MTKTTASDVKKARVVIDIDGEEYTLIPSPEAIITLSGKYGGLRPLMDAVQRCSVQAMNDIVCAGLGLEGEKAKGMLRAVASTNLMELLPKISDFTVVLSNGGRPLDTSKDESEDQKGGDGPL